MTKLLEKAFRQASKFPDIEQNELAKWLLEEFESERKWTQKFAESENTLDQLADEALKARKQSKTAPLDINKL